MGVYADRFDVLATRIEKNTAQLVRDTIVEVGTTVIRRTPILSGKARRNWISQIGDMPSRVLDAPSTPVMGETESILGVYQMAAAYKSGNIAHITNNLPYISRLNDGYSKQAPSMFVETAIQAAVRRINRTRILA